MAGELEDAPEDASVQEGAPTERRTRREVRAQLNNSAADPTGRAARDLYPTPPDLALAICGLLERLLPGVRQVIEPSAGPGAFVRAARRTWPEAYIHAIDVDARHRTACRVAGANVFLRADWLEVAKRMDLTGSAPPARLIVGNPPFSDAQAHLEAALGMLGEGEHAAFLLKLSFLGSRERAQTIWARPGLRYLVPLVPRPSFTGGGTDSSEYALFVWEQGFGGVAELLEPLVWRIDARARG